MTTGNWLEAKGSFIFDLNFPDGMEPMPKGEAARDDQSDENADQKEEPVHRESDEENSHDGEGSYKSCRAL